ncbi:MAG: penicillin acylase family protein, partial [Pirellulales bacterium]
LNRAFEVVPRSKADFAGLDAATRLLCEAFSEGLNYYLQCHPQVRPRLIDHFEPWHVLAFHRQITLELCFRYTRLTHSFLPRGNPRIWAAAGSNAWAISGSRTKSGAPMLMVNPHLPWFGYGQMLEAHLRSDEGWNMTGGTFYGSPMLNLGHNEFLGWTLTVNEPDVADVWRETFDREGRPLDYRYDGGYRTATRWNETIRIKKRDGMEDRSFTFTKTHHGPVVRRVDTRTYLTARIAGFHEPVPLRQALRMAKARNLDEFRSALAMLQMPIMNVIYADRDGNIYYVYGGRIPRRDPQFDWSEPVDGADPRTEWQGIHPLSELPQVLNPAAGFIQSCNSTPFTTSDTDNPDRATFPTYMIEDKDDDKRRAKRSREILRAMHDVTMEEFQEAIFDTTVYWARHHLPKYRVTLRKMQTLSPWIARRAEPLLNHLLEWDGRVTVESTAATLCEAWYEVLYGTEYPGEQLLKEFRGDRQLQLRALLTAARRLKAMHGTWKIPYGAIHRIQRQPYVADLWEIRFDDQAPSLPCAGSHGPMGVVFTQYYTPSIYLPLIITQRKRYGIVG